MRRFLFAVALVPPIALSAQTPAEFRLQPPTARLDAEFSNLITMRELSDGRTLLFDRAEDRLLVADFQTGTTSSISRKGQGPGEYESIWILHALGGDSTLAADLARWLILDGASVVRTLPPDTRAVRAVSLWPLGADRMGRVLSRHFAPRGESSYVALVNRQTGQSDTIARLRAGIRRAPVQAVTSPDGSTGVRIGRIPLNVSEMPLLFPDGWVAIARLEPYRVDWRAPNGRWTRGSPLPFVSRRMNMREREAYSARNSWSANATDWPAVLPPFDDAPYHIFFASPQGALVIRRIPSASERDTWYDIVDRRGALSGQLVLPANQHILGFGAQSVYVITTDNDGIQRLSRHPWPSAVPPKR